MAAHMPTGRRTGTTPRIEVDRRAMSTTAASAPQRVRVVVGLILLPLGAIIFTSAALLQASGWAGAVLVVGGAAVLAAGVGLGSAPAHAEHLRSRRGVERPDESPRGGGTS